MIEIAGMLPISQLPGLTAAQRQELITLAGDFRSTPDSFEELMRSAKLIAKRHHLVTAGKGPESLPARWADVPIPIATD